MFSWNIHEFTVLFTLPLGVACILILWQYCDSILEKKNRPVLAATGVALMASRFFAMGGLVSGLGVATALYKGFLLNFVINSSATITKR